MRHFALTAVFAAVLAMLVGGYLWLAGSAVVIDETGDVESAVVATSDGREQPLYRVWSGIFYTIPQLEGTIEVRCTNGSRARSGYVTRYWHARIRVTGGAPCARLVDE